MMTMSARMLLAGAACTLMTSCGGGDAEPASVDRAALRNAGAQSRQDGVRASPMVATPVAPNTLRAAPPASTSAPPAAAPLARARFNPDGLNAVQIGARLHQFAYSLVDEKSCTRGSIPCDEMYSARLNQKLRGSVGGLSSEDRHVYVDAVDHIYLPAVPAAVSIFVQSSPASKDLLHVTLEDRLGNRLYSLPPLPAGASAAFGWTRTDEASAAPLRLRLQAPAGPGDHGVEYLVLAVTDDEWRSGPQRALRSP